MRVSFDIDGLLTPAALALRHESPVWPNFMIRCYCEPLRAGSRMLFAELQRMQCDIWIYTTSTRSSFYVKLWLFMHGIRVRKVINADTHAREIRAAKISRAPSKYPPMFGIDLHVDDSPGVDFEAQQNGFNVLVISPSDENWAMHVLARIRQMQQPR